jgi:hypothetical protein
MSYCPRTKSNQVRAHSDSHTHFYWAFTEFALICGVSGFAFSTANTVGVACQQRPPLSSNNGGRTYFVKAVHQTRTEQLIPPESYSDVGAWPRNHTLGFDWESESGWGLRTTTTGLRTTTSLLTQIIKTEKIYQGHYHPVSHYVFQNIWWGMAKSLPQIKKLSTHSSVEFLAMI